MDELIYILGAAAFGQLAERMLTHNREDNPAPSAGAVLDYLPYLLGGVITACFSHVSPIGAQVYLLLHGAIMNGIGILMRYGTQNSTLKADFSVFSRTFLICGTRVIMVKITFLLTLIFTPAIAATHLLF